MKKLINHKIIKQALTIRRVEEKFLELFSLGKLNGTVHTCVGQELSANAFAGQLEKNDFIFSNHRCHGHYIAFTGDVRGLLAELLGKASGTSGGIGSSQHLCRGNFYSNGIQGGIVPVAAGYALGNKLKMKDAIGVVFIGDGTLGEGALYETMNIISKWEIPLLIVCENNFYAQSTPQSVNLSGSITARAKAFDIKTWHSDVWNPDLLFQKSKEAIDYVRNEKKPAFFHCDTYRLNAHSKGDDDRSLEEINTYKEKDFLNLFEQNEPEYFKRYKDKIDDDIDRMLATIFDEAETLLEDYFSENITVSNNIWVKLESINKRQVELLNNFFKDLIKKDEHAIFLGEDCLSPYGGAFKVAKDLSNIKPKQVFSTPISEAAITGISNGLALNGFKPFLEIMFGDFITLAFDQIVNHASKFHHMFNKQVDCPVVIRTPMGGRRGYGPTHSQSLDKFLIGIDHVKTVAINTFFNPSIIYNSVLKEKQPVIVLENKTDYGKKILSNTSNAFKYQRTENAYPVVHIKPIISKPDITIVAYGGMADYVASMLEELMMECDLKPELIVPSLLSEIDPQIFIDCLKITGKLVVIEEGSNYAAYSSELISVLLETTDFQFKVKRIAALPVPIPAVKSLELQVLPDKLRIINQIRSIFK